MALYETSALVAARVAYAYDAWLRVEEFPHFMDSVREVKRTAPGLTHWRVRVAGREAGWDAEIVKAMPDQCITWRSTTGTYCAGTVSFYDTTPEFHGCRIAVLIEYNPPGWLLGDLVDSLGFERQFQRAVQESLAAFKLKIEGEFAATPEGKEMLAAAAAAGARRRRE